MAAPSRCLGGTACYAGGAKTRPYEILVVISIRNSLFLWQHDRFSAQAGLLPAYPYNIMGRELLWAVRDLHVDR